MPTPRKHVLFLPTLSECIYRLMMGATIEQKKEMPDSDLKHFKNENAINHFAKSESMDRLLLMLTNLNTEWALLIYPNEDVAKQVIFNTYDQNRFLQKRKDIIEAMKRERVYAVTSRETMVSVQMMAQNAQTDVYHLSEHIKELVKKNREFASIPGYDQDVATATKGFDSFTGLLLETLNSADERATMYDLSELEMRILLTLYLRRNGTSDLISVAHGTGLQEKRNYIQKFLDKLEERKLIISDKPKVKKYGGKKTLYLITTEGERIAMGYVKYVYKKAYRKST